MNFTTFSDRWKINLFDKIGYCKAERKLVIYFRNSEVIEYFNVPETTVYQLIVSPNKDTFFKNSIENKYSTNVVKFIDKCLSRS